ncbi:MAG: hypothetical protein HYX66_00100 [Ignavibacteria bacterium]|nr:hypothetical protein [Ignavibacteria bacterium]
MPEQTFSEVTVFKLYDFGEKKGAVQVVMPNVTPNFGKCSIKCHFNLDAGYQEIPGMVVCLMH